MLQVSSAIRFVLVNLSGRTIDRYSKQSAYAEEAKGRVMTIQMTLNWGLNWNSDAYYSFSTRL